MARILSLTFVVLTLAPAAAGAEPPAAAPPGTVLVTQASVPLAQDACLDHSVKELGMSAKRAEGSARHWDIAPKFLHGGLAKEASASFTLDFEKTDKASLVKIRAAWPGAPKAKEVQLELEERLRQMAAKIAQVCGVVRADVACTITAPGAAAAPCAPPATP